MAAVQAYQFVTCSGNSGRDKAQSLTSVKKHVMRDYFRKHGKHDCFKKQGKRGARPVDGKTQQYKPTKTDGKPKSIIKPRRLCESNALSQSLVNSTSAIESLVSKTSRRSVLLGVAFPEQRSLVKTRNARQDRSEVNSSPGMNRSDPFDSLPVKNIPTDLLEWFPFLYAGNKSRDSWVHKCNLVWAQNIWHSASDDVGLFYTVLSQAERNRMIMTCSADDRRYLYLRGQALQALRRQISTDPNSASDTLILLVAYHIRFAIVEGDFTTARAHMRAASVLITQCQKTGQVGPFVMIHATLMDVKLAAASCTRPVLKDPDPGLHLETSLRLADVVRKRTRISLAHLPFDFRDSVAEEVMTGMHWHVLKYDVNYAKEIDDGRPMLLYCARLARTARHMRGLAADAWEEEEKKAIEDGEKVVKNAVKPRNAIILCLEFCGWMHDPAHLVPWVSHSEFMKRFANNVRDKLGHCLNLESNNLEDDWGDSGASQECLLWVLVIGFVMNANLDSGVDGYADLLTLPYLHALSRVMLSLQIFDLVQLQQALKVFPWTENFCETWSRSIAARLGLPSSFQHGY